MSAQLASTHGTLDDRNKACVLDIATECKRLDERGAHIRIHQPLLEESRNAFDG